MAQAVRCFSHMCEDLSSVPGTRVKTLGVVAHVCSPSDGKMGAETVDPWNFQLT